MIVAVTHRSTNIRQLFSHSFQLRKTLGLRGRSDFSFDESWTQTFLWLLLVDQKSMKGAGMFMHEPSLLALFISMFLVCRALLKLELIFSYFCCSTTRDLGLTQPNSITHPWKSAIYLY